MWSKGAFLRRIWRIEKEVPLVGPLSYLNNGRKDGEGHLTRSIIIAKTNLILQRKYVYSEEIRTLFLSPETL
jgi:hypothetical protein